MPALVPDALAGVVYLARPDLSLPVRAIRSQSFHPPANVGPGYRAGMTSPHDYLDFIDGSGLSVRDRFTAALRTELDRLPLPAQFDRQSLAEDMGHAVCQVFVDADSHGLKVEEDA